MTLYFTSFSNLDETGDETVYLAIRPENIELVDETRSPENYLSSNIVEVEAEVINFLGAIVRVTFILEEEEMLVDISEKEFEKLISDSVELNDKLVSDLKKQGAKIMPYITPALEEYFSDAPIVCS